MSSESKPIRFLAIDIDNCLVRYDDNYVPYVTDVIIDAVLKLDDEELCVFKGDRALVKDLADQYFLKYGQSILGFGLENHMSVRKLSQSYHAALDPDQFVNPSAEQMDQLRSFADWLTTATADDQIEDYVAFTQSTNEWAEKILCDRLGLGHLFNKYNIVSADRYGHSFKHRDSRPYSEAMISMNITDKSQVLVIDDSKSVLRFAFEKIGMKTCLISHGAPVTEEHQGYISAVANNIGDVPKIVASLS